MSFHATDLDAKEMRWGRKSSESITYHNEFGKPKPERILSVGKRNSELRPQGNIIHCITVDERFGSYTLILCK
jgi:hypothetical protein